jgi:4-hydroxy-2-oxoglutarate aldolase
MLTPDRLQGVFAAVPTPLRDERPDTGALEENLERWARTPLDGCLVLGTTGEASLLDEAERDTVVAAARRATPEGRVLLAGAGAEGTRVAVDRARRAFEKGADACVVLTPGLYSSWLRDEDLVRHYESLADAVPGPILLYQFPRVTGVALAAGAVERLSRHERVIGMKDSSGDPQTTAALASAFGDRGTVLTGSARHFLEALERGAGGGILALACLLPERLARLRRLWSEGDRAGAARIQEQVAPLAEAVPGRLGIPGLKAALEELGYRGGPCRGPLSVADAGVREEIRRLLGPFR